MPIQTSSDCESESESWVQSARERCQPAAGESPEDYTMLETESDSDEEQCMEVTDGREQDKGAYFSLLERLEGVVLETGDGVFKASLDPQYTSKDSFVAEFNVAEIPYEDRVRIKEGSFFTWTIGYATDKFRRLERTSSFYFRRFPKRTREEVAEIDAKAVTWLDALGD